MNIRPLLLIIFSCSLSFGQVTNEGKPKSWKLDLNTSKAHQMPSFDLKSLQEEDLRNDEKKDKPFRFGYEHQVSLGFEDGRWSEFKNGDRVWLLNVKSDGAKTLNFLFDEFYIPKGAKLYFYNNAKTDLLGAYTSSQNREDMQFGSWLVNGDNIWIEYYEPAEADFKGQLHLSKVVHGYRSVNDIPELSKALNDSGPCNQDVDCPVGEDFDNRKDQLKKSVGMTIVGASGFCSGVLINNTSNDQRQFFLTANHCLGGSVSNWAFRFNWISPQPSCSTTTNSPNGDFNQTLSGASLLANNSKSDFALLEIESPLPNDWDLVWAGWDRSGAVPDFTVGIHHPRGDIMKVSRDDDSPRKDARRFNGINDMENWFLDEWELGVTEPGSSGSPLFDQEGRIIGQLAGGSASCEGTENNGGFDYYGRFEVSWDFGNSPNSRLRDWLDPNETGEETLDQFPPEEVFENDIALVVEHINEPICGDEAFPNFRIINRGSENVTSATLTYQLGSEPEETLDWSGNLARGESDDIGTVSLDLERGVDLTATLVIDGVEDEFFGNNSITRSIDNFQDDTYITPTVRFTLLTDDFANETFWEFTDDDGNVIEQSRPNLENNTTYTETFDVEPGKCYELRIFDDEGDGICCGFGEGSYLLETSGEEEITQGGEFDFQEIISFRIVAAPSLEGFEFNVFPNPTSALLTIQSDFEEQFEVRIYDISGKLILSEVGTDSTQLNIETFSTGIYFVRVDNGVQSTTKKIIKQ